MKEPPIPFPRGCAGIGRRAIIQAAALWRAGAQTARAELERCFDAVAQATARLIGIAEELAICREENRILRARLGQVPPRQRPHYEPHERFAILTLCARAGWRASEAARRFLITPETLAGWRRRLDDEGRDELVKPREPVNKHTQRVVLIVKLLHTKAPQLGKRKLAALLERTGLKLAASTVERLRKQKSVSSPPTKKTSKERPNETAAAPSGAARKDRVVTAKRPHHVWHVDITNVTTGGMALPWWPFALLAMWPFSWRVVVVVDHLSRALLAFGVFKKEPTSANVVCVLEKARLRARKAPRHIISDRGSQFLGADYAAWCSDNDVRTRYGAIGKHGSIAIIERFIRSLKEEHLRRILIPFSKRSLEAELGAYRVWYNDHRPHEALAGWTPREKLRRRKRRVVRLEPRPRWPIADTEANVVRCTELELVCGKLFGHPHLPVFDLRAGA